MSRESYNRAKKELDREYSLTAMSVEEYIKRSTELLREHGGRKVEILDIEASNRTGIRHWMSDLEFDREVNQ